MAGYKIPITYGQQELTVNKRQLMGIVRDVCVNTVMRQRGLSFYNNKVLTNSELYIGHKSVVGTKGLRRIRAYLPKGVKAHEMTKEITQGWVDNTRAKAWKKVCIKLDL